MNENNGMNTVVALLSGIALGAALMYFLDPDRGHRRRALVRDQAVHLKHEAEDAASGKAQDLQNRARGVATETKGAVAEAKEAADALLNR